jgi:uncharacterized membrane protein YcaP (DUF421 family)
VILLVIGEATQQALLGEDFSLVQAAIVVSTLLLLERCADFWSWRWPRFARWSEGAPVLLVQEGRPLEDVLAHYRLDVGDVVAAGRERLGLATLAQIRFAVLETSGAITVVPWEDVSPSSDR